MTSSMGSYAHRATRPGFLTSELIDRMLPTSTTDVVPLVQARYPDLVLESPIQGWAFLDEFEQGIEAYASLRHKSPKDDRWLGVCYFQLFQDMNALEAFYRAIARGEEGARINLAHLYMFMERSQEGLEELGKLAPTHLTPYDWVLFHRVRSIMEEHNTDLGKALVYAEEAWRHVQGIPEFPILAPQVLSQLGILHGRMGRAQRALWFLERAGTIASGTTLAHVQMIQVHVFTNLGRYEDAQRILDGLDLGSRPHLIPEALMLRGNIAWGKKDIRRALTYFDESVATSLEAEQGGSEFVARLSLAAIFAKREFFDTASEHLGRASMLISDRSDQYSFRFRDTFLRSLQGTILPADAVQEYVQLIGEFGAMGLLQEQGWVRLHLADALWRSGESRFRRELDALQALAATLQNNNFLAREWTLLPELHELAKLSHPKIAGDSRVVLEVYTLGKERLVLGGKPVTVRLRRGVEMLAYFLEHREVELRRLLLDILPDEKPRSARSYFHQFRTEVHERIPGLRINFDEAARLYRLETDLDVLWDVAEMRAGRKMGEQGLFLPGSGNEWAYRIDDEMERFRDPPVERG